VRLAYENSNAKVKKEIDAILRAQNIGKKEQDKLKLIMTKSNVKIKAQTVIDGLVKKAEELIGQLKMKKRSKRMLLSMIDEIFV
jgi:hypothetical protein